MERPKQQSALAVIACVFAAVGLVVGGVSGFMVGRANAPTPPAPVAVVEPRWPVAPANQPQPQVVPIPQPVQQPPIQAERPKIKMTVAAFKESVHGRTREQVEAKHGPPHESKEDETGSWDGPISVYKGDFTGDKGEKNSEVWLHYSQGVVKLAAVGR